MNNAGKPIRNLLSYINEQSAVTPAPTTEKRHIFKQRNSNKAR